MNVFKWLTAAKVAVCCFIGSLFTVGNAMAFDLAGAQAEVVGYIDAVTVFIVGVGLAVLVMVMIAKALRWSRRAG